MRSSKRMLVCAVVALAASGCAHAMRPEQAAPMLDALFAPPRPEEIAAVEAEWARRDTRAHGVRVEWERKHGESGRTLVLSHTVGGVRHFGAVRVPDGAAGRKLPILVLPHGGEDGATGYDFHHKGPLAREWVQVLPSFRDEDVTLTLSRGWVSEGPASPWDRDVDDTMALLSAVIAHVPEADSSRVAVVGRSRGGGVALLMGIRDPRVDAVVDMYGPTDFFLPHVRRLAERAVRSRIPFVPGAGYLADSVLFALRDGRTTVARARMELVRRSAVYFAHRLPPVQIHHGARDKLVPVMHGDRLDAVLRSHGRAPEYFRYPAGRHGARHIQGYRPRLEAFLAPLQAGKPISPSSPSR